MISVCMPTYNGGKFIKAQLVSILTQLGPGDEIIISDDGSTDNTLKIVESFQENRIKVLHNARTTKPQRFKFMYTTCNIENALKQAKGDYIFLADQDDVWLENKVSILIEHLQSNDLVTSDCIVIDEYGKTIKNSYFELINASPGIFKNFKVNSYLGCCMAFKKELLSIILPISKYQVPHDIWIGLLTEVRGQVSFINTPLVAYRRHAQNLSPSGGVSGNSLYFKITYRLILLFSVVKRVWIR